MATYERLDYGSPDGAQIGGAAGDKIGFFGATPASQRANSVQAASVASATANIEAWRTEVTATLTALGLWKGGA